MSDLHPVKPRVPCGELNNAFNWAVPVKAARFDRDKGDKGDK